MAGLERFLGSGRVSARGRELRFPEMAERLPLDLHDFGRERQLMVEPSGLALIQEC